VKLRLAVLVPTVVAVVVGFLRMFLPENFVPENQLLIATEQALSLQPPVATAGPSKLG
jgi:hypothetical protein